ncbi:uncharacterized protein LOC115891704 [Sitophilus oryzae]|uniref:Uncharacterized protein LOC115891704 n=1 Tax=Sitophilus oryzae TaxID=7048 RepID=A0A6J2YZ56_SITOR|nr:uncharacterized protein LOC115891704 [Sitophilus oryzae]
MSKFLIYLFLCYVTLVSCDTSTPCSDSISCGEMQISGYLEKLEDTPSIPVIGGLVTLEKDTLPDEEQTRSSEDIVERSARFLASRSLKIRLPREEARSLVADARRSKIRKLILPLLLLLKLKAAIVLPILLSIIALVSFKGFGISLAALAVSGTTALKNLLEHAGSKIEVVPTPIGHWSRTGAVESPVPAYHYDYQQ